jgi:Xaa-Pro aminopeptidase
VVDYTACVDGYLSDQARIFSKGDLPDKFYRAHDTMLKIQDRVSKAARPGVPISEAYRIALRIADKYGLAEGFMGHPKPVPFIGHGIGLELDEWPVVSNNPRMTFQKGMVIALEPKYIFPGEGVVGIENVFTVEEHGLVRLTHFPDPIHIIMI